MTCNITSTPILPEPLPLYQPRARDPETASVVSSAPSYISEAPTYVSHRQSVLIPAPPAQSTSLLPPQSPTDRRTGLPPVRFAEGFDGRGTSSGAVGDISAHSYNICSWSSIYKGCNARQYQNVAARRASKASASPLFRALVATPPPPPSAAAFTAEASSASSSTTTTTTTITTTTPPDASASPASPAFPADIETSPVSPLEDPYLVGESAAAQARAQRIYREMCLHSDEAVKHESKGWDFLLAQMVDWEERERSWAKFRHDVGGRRQKLLNRRIGLGGLRR